MIRVITQWINIEIVVKFYIGIFYLFQVAMHIAPGKSDKNEKDSNLVEVGFNQVIIKKYNILQSQSTVGKILGSLDQSATYRDAIRHVQEPLVSNIFCCFLFYSWYMEKLNLIYLYCREHYIYFFSVCFLQRINDSKFEAYIKFVSIYRRWYVTFLYIFPIVYDIKLQ